MAMRLMECFGDFGVVFRDSGGPTSLLMVELAGSENAISEKKAFRKDPSDVGTIFRGLSKGIDPKYLLFGESDSY